MINIFRRISLAVIFLIAAIIADAKISFDLVPRQNVIEGTRFALTYRITYQNENVQGTPNITAPNLSGCTFLIGPNVSTRRQSVDINGMKTHTIAVSLTFIYKADKAGKVKIPSLTVQIAGNKYTAPESAFEVLPPNASSKNNQNATASPNASSTNGNAPDFSDFFVRIIFSKPSVYEQEGVIVTTKFYQPADNNVNVVGGNVSQLPVYEGCLSEELPVPKGHNLENYNGKNYFTQELSRALVYPQKAGKLTVTSAVSNLEIQAVTGYVRMSVYGFATPVWNDYTYTTPVTKATLEVKPLPEPKPMDFCGAVGDYSVSAQLTPEILRTNESATYSLSFSGSGNIKYLTVPNLKFPSTFDKYTPKTDVKASISGQAYKGSYDIEYPLVPEEVGHFEIPEQSFSYFSLSEKKYVTISVPAISANVRKGNAVSTSVDQKEVDTSMKDILHIHPLPDKITPLAPLIFNRLWFWTLWILAIAALIATIFIYRRQLKLAADVRGRKNARANKEARKRFKAAVGFMKNRQDDKFYEELARALKGYLSDKLAIPQSELISSVIEERLTEYGAPQDTIAQTLHVLDECEMARFTPNSSDSAMHDLYEQASSTIKSIESVKTK